MNSMFVNDRSYFSECLFFLPEMVAKKFKQDISTNFQHFFLLQWDVSEKSNHFTLCSFQSGRIRIRSKVVASERKKVFVITCSRLRSRSPSTRESSTELGRILLRAALNFSSSTSSSWRQIRWTRPCRRRRRRMDRLVTTSCWEYWNRNVGTVNTNNFHERNQFSLIPLMLSILIFRTLDEIKFELDKR